jgi:hypothetical protein
MTMLAERHITLEAGEASEGVELRQVAASPSAWRLPPEEEAVLLSVLAQPSEEQRARLQQLFASPLDLPRFWAVAQDLEVQPLVAHTLTNPVLVSHVPAALAQEAVLIRRRTALVNMARDGELQRIGRKLHAAGVPAVPLKGTQLAIRLYGTLSARRSGDIDVLVPREQLSAARGVLHEMGYAPAQGASEWIEGHSFHGVPYVRPNGDSWFVVELHWGLSDPRYVTVEYPQLWERVMGGPDGPLRPLPAEETLVFLALHLAKHHHGVLRLLADIDRLVRREGVAMDWELVHHIAERWNARWLLYFTLHRSRLLLEAPVPEAVLQRLCPPAWRRLAVGMLAGPLAILQPPSGETTCYNRFRLAYCAMLSPFNRTRAAYCEYLFPPVNSKGSISGPLRRGLLPAERIGRGVGRTIQSVTASLTEWAERAHQRGGAGSWLRWQ